MDAAEQLPSPRSFITPVWLSLLQSAAERVGFPLTDGAHTLAGKPTSSMLLEGCRPGCRPNSTLETQLRRLRRREQTPTVVVSRAVDGPSDRRGVWRCCCFHRRKRHRGRERGRSLSQQLAVRQRHVVHPTINVAVRAQLRRRLGLGRALLVSLALARTCCFLLADLDVEGASAFRVLTGGCSRTRANRASAGGRKRAVARAMIEQHHEPNRS
jgi:hypothetical protein